jgi:quinohemoprotein ethanol dehydrogenase
MTVSKSKLLAAIALLACGVTAIAVGANGTASPAPTRGSAGDVSAERLQADAAAGANWMTYGRTYSEQRFSPLKQIDETTVKQLGVAWSADIPSPDGLGATPIVVDGVIYMSGSQDLVEALDAATGRKLWSWRPDDLDLSHPYASWSSRFNRGVALWKGTVFIGTGDCGLVALSAATGRRIWEVRNCDPAAGYASDGAPRVVHDRVLIGSEGADTGARGYVSAYDTRTGHLDWRFYTVPGDPAKGFEQPILKEAAKSWKGADWWKHGGGTVADTIVYDPELNRVYFGTDTAVPWGHDKGDALFSDSIIAVDADTGQYLWHYQEVPDDAWDYESTAQIILTDLTIAGKPHKVLMQAAKDGFFYVLDRETGRPLSATPFVKVTWASRVDLASGRPVLAPNARFYLDPSRSVLLWPSIEGASDWRAVSFSPLTGLVYLSALNAPSRFYVDQGEAAVTLYFPPPTAKVQPDGRLIAWDPIARKARWSVTLKYPYNGGTLATAGNLVFQGTAEGVFTARRASDGQLLWSAPVISSTQAPPVTYLDQGKQYVLLPVGASGDVRAVPEYGDPPTANGPSRLIAFALDAHGTVPKGLIEKPSQPEPPPPFGSPALVARGGVLFKRYSCMLCHGMQLEVEAGGTVPDLRYLPPAIHDEWNRIVIDGELSKAGMPSFKGALSADDAQAIRAFVLDQAWKLYRSGHRDK